MSVFGKKVRAGVVGSSFFSSSRFCCTSSSCAGAMILSPLLQSADLDRLGFVALRPWERQGEHPVSVLGRYAVRVQLHRQADCAIKGARDAFSPMHAGIAAVLDRFLARNAYGVASHLQAECIFAHAR